MFPRRGPNLLLKEVVKIYGIFTDKVNEACYIGDSLHPVASEALPSGCAHNHSNKSLFITKNYGLTDAEKSSQNIFPGRNRISQVLDPTHL